MATAVLRLGRDGKLPPLVLRGMLARFFLPVQCVTLREFYVQGLLTDGILEQSLDCPVCLERLVDPVAPACVHAM